MINVKLVSVSGGKDSTATLLLALERHPQDVMACFADTGNEHPIVYEYLDYLEQQTGIVIHRVKADFSDKWQRRIDYVRDKWPEKMRNPKPILLNKSEVKEDGAEPIYKAVEPIPDHEITKIVSRALSVLEQGPTGIPFLDLCLLKARFPSRMAQFCTQELKALPLTEFALQVIDDYGSCESWQGVRAEESERRAKLPEREDKGGGYSIYRPILKWTVQEVFDLHKKHGIDPNPLYKLGMGRVGCMPCVNCGKAEVLNIYKRYPEHIERINEWEILVGMVSKRHNATFFELSGDNETAYQRGNIMQVVEWSKTQHGGKKMDLFAEFEEPEACSSSYGLCE